MIPSISRISSFKILLLLVLTVGQSHADDVLAKITVRLAKASIAQGEFHQEKQLKILRKPLLSSGTFTYDKNKGVLWKTLTPMPSLLLVKETQLSTNQGRQSVPPAFGKVFKALLGGDLSSLAETFNMSATDGLSWQLQLTPKDELLKRAISNIKLTGDSELRQLDLLERTGNQTHISFNQISHPKELSKDQIADFERLSSKN